jgi:methylase of polypeptide subunit release factors
MDFFPEVRPEQGAALRRALSAHGFTTAAACARLGIASIYDFRSIREGRTTAITLGDPLDVLIRLFMDVEPVDRATLEAMLPPADSGLLDELGLLHRLADGRCHATVLLYPTESLWIASDLNANPTPDEPAVLREDAVYPAITRNTRHFLASLPTTACDRFLELCAGTGIAALLAARYAGHSWATDITERATSFATFNAALNGIENCTVLRSDLYAAVAGQTFDRIVAHPPYMPSLQQKYVFRDGGEDGEQITRGAITGLPAHLAPGGSFHCTCMLTDRKQAPAEQRLRGLLGESAGDFDIIVLSHQSFHPTEYYFQLALAGRATLDEVKARHEIFTRLEVERLVYGSMLIRRHATRAPAYTTRRHAGPSSGLAELEWLDRWERAAADPDGRTWLAGARPTVSPDCRMRLTHTPAETGWEVSDCLLTTAYPFTLDVKCPAWTASFLNRCDGRRTVRDHLAWLKAENLVAADVPEDGFTALVHGLVGGGFLETPDFPLPRRARE